MSGRPFAAGAAMWHPSTGCMGTSTPSLLQRTATGEATVRGAVRTVTFRSDDLTFSVVRLVCVDGEEVVVVGPLGSLTQGECIRVTGRWEDHPSHGRRLRAQSVVPELPDTPGGIERLLGSGFVPDVGATLAQRIVQRFGSSTLDVIAEHPGRLSEVEGIGSKRALRIQEAFRARRAEVESKAFLQGLGMGPALARKVWERFGTDTAAVIRDNPYRLAEEIAGIGFLTADRIGRAVGIADDDPRRIAGATLFLLLEAVEEGHTGLAPEELAVLADRFAISRAQVHEALTELAARAMVVIDKDLVYPPPLYDAEVRLAAEVGALLGRRVGPLPPGVWGAERVREALGVLHPLQREAVEATGTASMLVLTGGPGTGKTTTVRAMVALHAAAGHKMVLAAPTGRAAKRLSEATGHPASTLHRLLEWNPRLGRFQRDRTSPLDADFVLVDEASMVDVQLGASLVQAVRLGARLVWVGDADQLPPVGPGTVLADLLATPQVRAVRLTEVFRQAAASAIVRGAYEVLQGIVPRGSTPRGKARPGSAPVAPGGELFLVPVEDAAEAAGVLVDLVAERIPRSFGIDPLRDVQVLVPTHRGPLGAQSLNEALQARLNPATARGRKGLGPGDKVMQRKNDYDLDVWNGDVGTIVSADDKAVVVNIDGRDVVYVGNAVDNLSLAYAATVHKAQGSEYDAVVMGLHTSHFMLLNRSLLYTAITRARRLAVIVGSPRALRMAVDSVRAVTRHGNLRVRLAEALLSTRGDTVPHGHTARA